MTDIHPKRTESRNSEKFEETEKCLLNIARYYSPEKFQKAAKWVTEFLRNEIKIFSVF